MPDLVYLPGFPGMQSYIMSFFFMFRVTLLLWLVNSLFHSIAFFPFKEKCIRLKMLMNELLFLQVILSNILQSIIDSLKENMEVSYLFIKPVTKKEAPDYFNIIKRPMDLSSIRDKVRNLEYKNREDFRHDVWQITYNAHRYNDGRNPSIPPLADQLLELCDYHLEQRHRELSDAEGGI